jgi:hypothetical protein
MKYIIAYLRLAFMRKALDLQFYGAGAHLSIKNTFLDYQRPQHNLRIPIV